MKKIFFTLLCLLAFPLSVFADDDKYEEPDPYVYQSNFTTGGEIAYKEFTFSKPYAKKPQVTVTDKDVDALLMINGSFVKNGSAVIVDGRTLIPARIVTENLGYKVDWQGATNQVTISDAKNNVKLIIGEKIATHNGNKVSLDAPAKIINGTTYIPIRFVSEVFSLDVGYDKDVIKFPIVWICNPIDTKNIKITENMAFSEVMEEIKEDATENGYNFKNDIEKNYTFKSSGSLFGRFWCVTATSKQFPKSPFVYYLVDKYTDEIYVGCYFGLLDDSYLTRVFMAN